MKATPTPKTDRAIFEFDRGDREAVVRLARDLERRIEKVLRHLSIAGSIFGFDEGAVYIRRTLTRSTSRKPSTSQDKPKAANRKRAKFIQCDAKSSDGWACSLASGHSGTHKQTMIVHSDGSPIAEWYNHGAPKAANRRAKR